MADTISQELPVVEAQKGGIEIIDRLAEEWRELCLQAPNDQPFYRPEYIKAYLHAFVPKAKLLVIAARVGNRLRAVLPLIEEQGRFCGLPLRKLRAPVNDHLLRFDLVRAASTEGAAAVLAVWRFLKELPDWDIVEFSHVPQGSSLEQLVEAATADGHPTVCWEMSASPYVPLREWREPEDARFFGAEHGFQKDLRRRLRKLTAQTPVRLRRVDNANPDALQCFYELERSGWKGREGTAIICSEETQRFYDEIARSAGKFGYLSLYFLDAGDRTVASHFGLTYGGRYFSPKGAIDDNYRHYAVGHLLVNAILHDCLQRGIFEYDMMGAYDEMKSKWTAEARPHAFLCISQKGIYGRVLDFYFRFRRKARKSRQWLRIHNPPRAWRLLRRSKSRTREAKTRIMSAVERYSPAGR